MRLVCDRPFTAPVTCLPAGNREAHYRDVALGATLVHFLGLQKPTAVNQLTARIDAELPDMCAGHAGSQPLARARKTAPAVYLSSTPLTSVWRGRLVRALWPAAYRHFSSRFVWFNERSLHVTVRGLFGA